MRAHLFLALALVAAGSLAGCIGGEKEGGVVDTATDKGVGADGVTSAAGGAAQSLRVLAPLTASLALDAPEWIQSGTEVPVSLTVPANAKGAVSYTWAVGPLPGTVEVTPAKADTGSAVKDFIQAGATKSITYGTSGVYRMHCHPHPWMLHNVTVIDGYAGPKTVDVSIVDGATQGEFRYVPENIVVGAGTVVNYKNLGEQPHTATAMGAQEPPLQKLPLATNEGTVKLEGDGWLRVVGVFQDSEGRIGFAEKRIYVTAELPQYGTTTHEFSFDAAVKPLAGTPAAAAAKSVPVSLEQGGFVFLNYTFQDAASGAGAPQNLAQVEVHFTLSGETQDTLTGGPDAANSLSGRALPGSYTLKVVPVQGARVTGTVTIEVVYDLVPPEPGGTRS
ncbi:MAG TPA: hypothetical protein VM582_03065 [Candidatus Thermoplasmatota archaeon]|nr:hypothetical protein [Candidatus Thermoplasmatota archaeon]